MKSTIKHSFRALFQQNPKNEDLYKLARAEEVAFASIVLDSAIAFKRFLRENSIDFKSAAGIMNVPEELIKQMATGSAKTTLNHIALMSAFMDRKPKLIFQEIHLIDHGLKFRKESVKKKQTIEKIVLRATYKMVKEETESDDF